MKKLRFLVSLITKDNDYQLQQAASAETAARELGIELQIVYADGDTITQSTQVLKAIQAQPTLRPDGIIVEPAGGTGLPQVAKAAIEAGIAWGLVNHDAGYVAELRRTTKIPIFIVTSDHTEIGRIQARQLAALVPEGGAVLYVIGPTESATVKDRKAGFDAVCPKNLRVTVLRGKWTEESGYRSLATWLKLGGSSKMSIVAVAAQNDAMAMGARKALKEISNPQEREKWMSLPFMGIDGLPMTGQAWVRSGSLAATVITPPMVGQAAQLMAHALRTGASVPERTVTLLESFPAIAKLSRLKAVGGQR
ncbi:MAG TPA: sugar ABC transporter substrate-binding protein [Candidatus Acidoferrum sp.]|nr:sugar ABC transporter substrate-binding protein [Candidatus Acidoferrum sp.]